MKLMKLAAVLIALIAGVGYIHSVNAQYDTVDPKVAKKAPCIQKCCENSSKLYLCLEKCGEVVGNSEDGKSLYSDKKCQKRCESQYDYDTCLQKKCKIKKSEYGKYGIGGC